MSRQKSASFAIKPEDESKLVWKKVLIRSRPAFIIPDFNIWARNFEIKSTIRRGYFGSGSTFRLFKSTKDR